MNIAFIVIVALLVGACSSSPDAPGSEPRGDAVYRTGTNLPTRDPGARSVSRETFESQGAVTAQRVPPASRATP